MYRDMVGARDVTLDPQQVSPELVTSIIKACYSQDWKRDPVDTMSKALAFAKTVYRQMCDCGQKDEPNDPISLLKTPRDFVDYCQHQLGLNMRETSRAMGVHPSTLYAWLKHDQIPRRRVLQCRQRLKEFQQQTTKSEGS
jgi:predicted DNA-binding transcriptional regulator AlpA